MKQLPEWFRLSLAGGLAGTFTKTSVAPMERIKMLMQLQSQREAAGGRGVTAPANPLTLTRRIVRDEGLLVNSVPPPLGRHRVNDLTKRFISPFVRLGVLCRRFTAGMVRMWCGLSRTMPSNSCSTTPSRLTSTHPVRCVLARYDNREHKLPMYFTFSLSLAGHGQTTRPNQQRPYCVATPGVQRLWWFPPGVHPGSYPTPASLNQTPTRHPRWWRRVLSR